MRSRILKRIRALIANPQDRRGSCSADRKFSAPKMVAAGRRLWKRERERESQSKYEMKVATWSYLEVHENFRKNLSKTMARLAEWPESGGSARIQKQLPDIPFVYTIVQRLPFIEPFDKCHAEGGSSRANWVFVQLILWLRDSERFRSFAVVVSRR